MKTISTLPAITFQQLLCIFSFLGILPIGQETIAQSPITVIFQHSQNATTATSYTGPGATGKSVSSLAANSYTYNFGTNVSATNNTSILDSFTAGINFHYQPVTPQGVLFRRVDNLTVTGLRKSILIEQSGGTVPAGGTAALLPDYDDSLERIFSQRMLNIGIDNLFQNDSVNNNSNIERMDMIFQNGVSATDNTKAGFSVFERGASGGHDPFYIAAIMSLDASHDPSAYYNAVSVTSGDYGSGVLPTMPYLILRKNSSDAKPYILSNNSPQGRDGTFLTFQDLGVPAYATVYGYSIFSPDDVVSPASNMVNYTNGANFPTTTLLGSGGIDPLAVTGLWVANASYIVLAENLDGFQATLINDQVRLNWQLYTADNGQKLSIERSADGIAYSTLLSFTAPPPGPQSAFDAQPLPGTDYYRLKLTTIDGTAPTYSNVCRIDKTAYNSGSISIYPNPVINKQFSLNISGFNSTSYELRLLDIRGNLILKQALNGGPLINSEFHLPDQLPPGIYAVQLSDDKGNKIFTRTITVE